MKKFLFLFAVIISTLAICVAAAPVSGTQNEVAWSYEDGTLTLSGEGNIYFSFYNIENLPTPSSVHTLVLSERITNVPFVQDI